MICLLVLVQWVVDDTSIGLVQWVVDDTSIGFSTVGSG